MTTRTRLSRARRASGVVGTPVTSGSSAADATFWAQHGNSGAGHSLKSFDVPERDVRHHRFVGYVASNGGIDPWDSPSPWAQGTSRLAATPWS
ncbi:AbfB domain-containing protein [Kitasatospora sp. NPDC096128]|uniref:AbfB domain-containing protein n=1 Tax=Kitasatospora sp. NPDC096128 TaxID=3155547 RepID=UPI0033222FA4